MRERARGGHAIDFQDLIGRFTLDSTTGSLFGTCLYSLKGRIPHAHNAAASPSAPPAGNDAFIDDFLRAFNEALEAGYIRDTRADIWPLWEIGTDISAQPMKVVSA